MALAKVLCQFLFATLPLVMMLKNCVSMQAAAAAH